MPKTVKDTTSSIALSDLLTRQQVMERLGISSRSTLWVMMREQGLPYIKLGDGPGAMLRFSARSLEKWLAQHERQNTF